MKNTNTIMFIPTTGDALLENSKDGDIITGKQWNSVMSILRDTINHNARRQAVSGSNIISFSIDTTEWDIKDNKDPHLLYHAHNLGYDPTEAYTLVKAYVVSDSGLSEYTDPITISETGTITLYSRKPLQLMLYCISYNLIPED